MRTIVTLLASLALAPAGELHQAARKCNEDRLQTLLSQHPQLNEPEENGLPPLHIAIDARQVHCVGLLLDAGADRDARDRQGRTAYDAADKITDMQSRGTIRLYLFHNAGEKTLQKPDGPMPWSLEYAVMHRQTDLTKMLLSLGSDPNQVGTRGTTRLADAALKGDLEAVRALLSRGAKPNAVSQAGMQPIQDAVLGGNIEVIRELVKQGADVNARTRDEAQTPLHIAVAMDKLNAAETLLTLGADLTLKDSNGRTPIAVAERAGLTGIATLLKRAAGK